MTTKLFTNLGSANHNDLSEFPNISCYKFISLPDGVVEYTEYLKLLSPFEINLKLLANRAMNFSFFQCHPIEPDNGRNSSHPLHLLPQMHLQSN